MKPHDWPGSTLMDRADVAISDGTPYDPRSSGPSEPPRMGVVLTGHVDHGKSTVLGRLLADTGSLPLGKLDAIAASCERLGQRFEYAFLADALRDERAQGITIDSARVFFRSPRREYLLVDAPGHIEPFPLIHIDTSFKIPEMIRYRDRLVAEWGLDLIFGRNDTALAAKQTFPDGNVDRLTCCRLLKTDALKRTLSGEGERFRFDHATKRYEVERDPEPFTGVIVGVRADEEGSRSKERYFSPRGTDSGWDVGDQPPEFWDQYNTEFRTGTHVRIHPLLDWTAADIWEYIDREKLPTVSLYCDAGEGTRYRSLGCGPCTRPVESDLSTPAEIVVELKRGRFANVAERAGGAQDKEDGGGLETLRRDGYM